MAKNLKLMGLASYTGVATMKDGLAEIVRRGEIARFSDEIAEKITDGGRTNAEGEWVSYWVEAPDDASVSHNFTKDTVKIETMDAKQLEALVVEAKQPKQRVARRASK